MRFLSDEWLAALDDAARRSRALAAAAPSGEPLVFEQVVVGAPGGVVRYRLVLDGAGARVERGDGGPVADVTFETDYATACVLAGGGLNAQQALAQGRMRLRGSVERLVGLAEAVAALDDVFAAVRDATELPEPPAVGGA